MQVTRVPACGHAERPRPGRAGLSLQPLLSVPTGQLLDAPPPPPPLLSSDPCLVSAAGPRAGTDCELFRGRGLPPTGPSHGGLVPSTPAPAPELLLGAQTPAGSTQPGLRPPHCTGRRKAVGGAHNTEGEGLWRKEQVGGGSGPGSVVSRSHQEVGAASPRRL